MYATDAMVYAQNFMMIGFSIRAIWEVGMLVLLIMFAVEVASRGKMYASGLMTIGLGFQMKLREDMRLDRQKVAQTTRRSHKRPLVFFLNM
jgi:hypothetical protein